MRSRRLISGLNFAASRARRYEPLREQDAAASDPDHDDRVEGEAVPVVHAVDVRFLFHAGQAPVLGA